MSAQEGLRPPTSVSAPTPALRAVGVHKSFGALEVLRGVDLVIAPHEVGASSVCRAQAIDPPALL